VASVIFVASVFVFFVSSVFVSSLFVSSLFMSFMSSSKPSVAVASSSNEIDRPNKPPSTSPSAPISTSPTSLVGGTERGACWVVGVE